VTIGKFVLALGPLIKMAASSYARAASSAVSNVPSHTLLFLQQIGRKKEEKTKRYCEARVKKFSEDKSKSLL
jgi:hypothetical protein